MAAPVESRDANLEKAELSTYPDIGQAYGGYFTPGSPPPSRTSPPRKKLANPPAWMKIGARKR